jgi:predicted HTH domain antitoxin
MQQVIIELPEDLARQVGPYQGRLQELVLLGLSQLKAQEALTLYTRGIVSFARAAEIAGLTRPEMIRQARAFGIRPRWSEQMVEEAVAST